MQASKSTAVELKELKDHFKGGKDYEKYSISEHCDYFFHYPVGGKYEEVPREKMLWDMFLGKVDMKLPLALYHVDIEKYSEVSALFDQVTQMKRKGILIDDMWERYGCPKCGVKEMPEGDGEAEADGCAMDWAITTYWGYYCQQEGCNHRITGSDVSRSGGRW